MPHLIKPGQVKIITQDGEIQVHLTLDLNVNLTTDGKVSVSSNNTPIPQDAEESPWMIPEFGNLPKIDFGKKVNND